MTEDFQIVRDGKLIIPLFHGTSTLFLDSIQANGLGGTDCVTQLGLRRAARRLLQISPLLNDADPHSIWNLEMYFCRKLAKEPANDELGGDSGFNFRYGGLYLTPSRSTARRYASAIGSEALRSVLRWIELLEAMRPHLAEEDQFTKIRRFAAKKATPVILMATDVEVKYLRAEQGGSIATVLRYIQDAFADPEIFETMTSQCNFEFLGTIVPKNLRVFLCNGSNLGNDIPELDQFIEIRRSS